MGSRSRTSRLALATTSTNSGTGCRRAATCHRPCVGWTYRRHQAGRDHWGYPADGLGKRWSADIWSRYWSLPRGLVWISAATLGDRRDSDGAPAMLAVRLGRRHRHQGFLRQHRCTSCFCGPCVSTRLALGAALYRTLADGTGDDGGWQSCAAGSWDATRGGHQPTPGQPVPALRVRCYG